MLSSILGIAVVLWLVLAVSVGFHARGYNRSAVAWFCIVAVTGIFGLAFYLLKITSQSPKGDSSDSAIDHLTLHHGPRIALTALVGSIAAFILVLTTFPLLETLVSHPGPVGTNHQAVLDVGEYTGLLAILAGAVGGPVAYYNNGWRQLGFRLSQCFFAGVTASLIHAAVTLFGLDGTGVILLPIIAIIIIAVPYAWERIYGTYTPRATRNDIETVVDSAPVAVTRRRLLAGAGSAALACFGAALYSGAQPAPEDVEITTIQPTYEDGDPVVNIVINNPVDDTIPVEVEVWIEDEFTNSRGKTFTNSVSKDVDVTLPPNQRFELAVRFGDEKTDFGRRNPGIGSGFTVDKDLTEVNLVE